MHIHIKRNDECIRDIAEGYGVSEQNLRQINEIYEGDAAEGEELLILTPTRSYTVQPNDSLERIALRFGVLKKDILYISSALTISPKSVRSLPAILSTACLS